MFSNQKFEATFKPYRLWFSFNILVIFQVLLWTCFVISVYIGRSNLLLELAFWKSRCRPTTSLFFFMLNINLAILSASTTGKNSHLRYMTLHFHILRTELNISSRFHFRPLLF